VPEKLVDIPSVSGEIGRRKDILRCAEVAAELLDEAGAKVDILERDAQDRYPTVFGPLDVDPKLPTVIVYNHLDVQPANPAGEGWETDPFDMVLDKDPASTAAGGRRTTRAPPSPCSMARGSRIPREHPLPLELEELSSTEPRPQATEPGRRQWRRVRRQRTSPTTTDTGPQTTESGPQATESGPQTTESGPQTTESGPQTTYVSPTSSKPLP